MKSGTLDKADRVAFRSYSTTDLDVPLDILDHQVLSRQLEMIWVMVDDSEGESRMYYTCKHN